MKYLQKQHSKDQQYQKNRGKFEIWLIDVWPSAKRKDSQYLASYGKSRNRLLCTKTWRKLASKFKSLQKQSPHFLRGGANEASAFGG